MNLSDLLGRAEPIPFSGCFVLTSKTDKDGYVRLRNGGEHVKAHRLAYELSKGEIPEGYLVCHHCDVRCCIDPEHLFTGTHTENMQDMMRKGRMASTRGEQNGKALLAERQILNIRDDIRSHNTIAADYGVSKSCITKIKTRKVWRHI